MKNIIILIGMRGTGKSTIGRLLSQQMNWNFIDSDNEIEKQTGQSISDFFKTDREEYFRNFEEDIILSSLLSTTSLVLATGGGAVISTFTRNRLKNFFTIWLRASVSTQYERIKSQNRPALTELPLLKEIEYIYNLREYFYRDSSTISLNTDSLTPMESVLEIQHLWQQFQHNNLR